MPDTFEFMHSYAIATCIDKFPAMTEVVGSGPKGTSGSSASGVAPLASDTIQVASAVERTTDESVRTSAREDGGVIATGGGERPGPSPPPIPPLGPRKSIVPKKEDGLPSAAVGTVFPRSDISETDDRPSSRAGENVAASATGDRPSSRVTGDRPSSRAGENVAASATGADAASKA